MQEWRVLHRRGHADETTVQSRFSGLNVSHLYTIRLPLRNVIYLPSLPTDVPLHPIFRHLLPTLPDPTINAPIRLNSTTSEGACRLMCSAYANDAHPFSSHRMCWTSTKLRLLRGTDFDLCMPPHQSFSICIRFTKAQ